MDVCLCECVCVDRPNYPHVFHLCPIISTPPPWVLIVTSARLLCQTGLWLCVVVVFLVSYVWIPSVDLDLFAWTNDTIKTIIKLSNKIKLVGVYLASGVQLKLVLALCFLQNFSKNEGKLSRLIRFAFR